MGNTYDTTPITVEGLTLPGGFDDEEPLSIDVPVGPTWGQAAIRYPGKVQEDLAGQLGTMVQIKQSTTVIFRGRVVGTPGIINPAADKNTLIIPNIIHKSHIYQ